VERRLLGHRLGAHDDVALLERGAQRGDLVVRELVLVGECLELLLLDETAIGSLLDEALGRREVVQMNRVAQLNPFPGRGSGLLRCGGAARGDRCSDGGLLAGAGSRGTSPRFTARPVSEL
jgi:hypothetical protein